MFEFEVSVPMPTLDQVNAALAAIQVFYGTSLRPSFFTGFLTLSSFLFTMSSFIMVNIKKDVYDDDEYRKSVLRAEKQKADMLGKPLPADDEQGLYGPLIRLNDRLFTVIYFALGTSIAQVTIGLIPHGTAALFCMGLVLVTAYKLVDCLKLFKGNLATWFKILDQRTQKKRAKMLQDIEDEDNKFADKMPSETDFEPQISKNPDKT